MYNYLSENRLEIFKRSSWWYMQKQDLIKKVTPFIELKNNNRRKY